jgi:hypothetical protein
MAGKTKTGQNTPHDDSDFDFAEGWRPEPGDILRGDVVDVTMAEDRFNARKRYPIVTIARQEDGEKVAVHAFHQVLQNALRSVRPMPGDSLAIKYTGRKARKGDDEATTDDRDKFHVYQVRKLNQTADDLWGAMATESGGGDFNDDPPF